MLPSYQRRVQNRPGVSGTESVASPAIAEQLAGIGQLGSVFAELVPPIAVESSRRDLELLMSLVFGRVDGDVTQPDANLGGKRRIGDLRGSQTCSC